MESIRPYNTFKVDHHVSEIYVIESIDQLRTLSKKHVDPIIIGGGSNVLFVKDVERSVFLIDLKGIEIVDEGETWKEVKIAAGEDWHDVVMWSIDQGLGGIENLSLIPGKCGAAPMQNIGAYGTELADVLIQVGCMDKQIGALFNMNKEACKLGYRDSVFKHESKDQYVITSITIRLTKQEYHIVNVSYGDIKHVLDQKGITKPTIQDVSDAVIAIRSSKLPNPAQIPNAGSFFKNPIIPLKEFNQLKLNHQDIPSYPVSQTHCKVPAGWLIDRCGWKGIRIGDVGVHTRQALVLVNHGSKDGQDIVNLSRMIQKKVLDVYNIKLVPEVNMIG